ncbi:hypothetical protein [Vibrio sp. HN007]|uniref:hypothetical protein n=1 Tax=Vibrio iocasae TaxID=3098914 RepID=UPI0035D40851
MSQIISGEDVLFVGHSIGGGLASAAVMASGGSAMTFNAVVHNNTVVDISKGWSINNYVSTDDVIQKLNSLTPNASLRGDVRSLGPVGQHGISDMCRAVSTTC